MMEYGKLVAEALISYNSSLHTLPGPYIDMHWYVDYVVYIENAPPFGMLSGAPGVLSASSRRLAARGETPVKCLTSCIDAGLDLSLSVSLCLSRSLSLSLSVSLSLLPQGRPFPNRHDFYRSNPRQVQPLITGRVFLL